MIVSIFISLCRRIRSSIMKHEARSDGIRLNTATSVMFMVAGGKPVFKFITVQDEQQQENKQIRKCGGNSVSFIQRNNKAVFKFLNK